jgi:ATP-binding cassette subfamily C protein LapB
MDFDNFKIEDNTYTDSLLQSIVIIAKLNNSPITADALIENLPTAKGKAEPRLFSLKQSKALFSRAAEKAGFTSKLVKKKISQISPLVLPCILTLKDNNACVLKSFSEDKKQATIIMPHFEESEITIDIEELEKEYLGFAFYIKKISGISEINQQFLKEKQGHWFWNTLWKSKIIYLDVIVASIVVNLLVLATPLFTKNIYDRVIPNNATETLWVLALGVATALFLDTILKFIRSYFLELAGKKSDIIMSSIIFEKVLNMKMSVMPKSVGSFASNLKEFESIRSFFTSGTIAALIDFPFLIIFLIVIYYIGGTIVAVPIIIILIIFIYSLLVKKTLQKSIEATYQASALKNGVLIETLTNMETIKTLGGSGRAQFQWEEAVGNIAEKNIKIKNITNSINTLTSFLIQMNNIIVIIYGVYLIKEMEMSMGGLIAVSILSSRAIAPMARFVALLTNYEQTKTAFKTLDDIMKVPVDRPEGKIYVKRPSFKGEIEFRNVSFTYPDETKPALDDVSFKINPKDHVGLIGKIGSGKSTLAKLVLGIYQPDSGKIFIDGIDINQIDPADLRRAISYVPQDVILFKGTIKENIIYKAPYVDDEYIIRASKISAVENFVKQHPMGYDMPIAEQGKNLSGGQRQCVGIARAFLIETPLVLLDEPTESMDNTTENIILNNLHSVLKDKTLLISTHKMNLLSLVNRIILLDNGKIIMDDKKEVVLKKLSTSKTGVQNG